MPTKISEQRLTIAEAARLLDRSPHTLRSWDRNKSMPRHLRPKRDEHGHRYWTSELIDEIREWMEDNDFHPGRGIAYHPSPERLAAHIARIRNAAANTRSTNGTMRNPDVQALAVMIKEAIVDRDVAPAKIVASLPRVVEDLRGQGYDITLDEALKVAGDVIAAVAQ